MKTQSQIQMELTELIKQLSQLKVKNSNLPISEVVKDYPDIKEKWDVLMADAEALRAKGEWK